MKSGLDHARELTLKAEHDLKAAEIGLEHDAPLDTVCFHFQQAAEKLLKAVLTYRNIEYPLTHDLVQLLDVAEPEFPALAQFRQALPGFFPYAVRMRYDGALYPSRDEALTARDTVKDLRSVVYGLLPPEACP